jgi:ribosome recycling factor
MEESMIEQIFKETDSKMHKTINALVQDLSTIRTGRATPSLVEHIKVDYHGVPTPVNQIASISIPEAKMIVIQPWDRSAIREIEKAILKSDLGLNPSNDGTVVRIIIPALTEERRKELSRSIHKRAEETKVILRNIRRDGIENLRKTEKNKEISQDDYTRATDRIQKLTDGFIDNVAEIEKDKEAEIMEI